MKIGKSLVELAQEIQRRSENKKDYVASTMSLSMVAGGKDTHLMIGEDTIVEVNELAHQQIASELKIPAPYYNKMKSEAPELLANNVNEWFQKYPERRMIRTLDKTARAFLSDRFKPMENEDLAEAVLPPLMKLGVEVISCDVTDKRFYLKAVDQRINHDIPSGKKMGDGSHTIFDTLCPAITITNSEVGLGSMSVLTSVFTKACTNLATFGDSSIRKYHVGGRHELGDNVYSVLSESTRKVTDQALWLQVRDVVSAAFQEARFKTLCDQMAIAGKDRIEDDPVKVIELTAKKFGMNNSEQSSVLKHLIEGGDLTRYGLFNAVTRTAEDIDSYDRATEFERFGGQIIELPKAQWAELVVAA